MARTGRPKTDNPRTVQVMISLTEDEAVLVRSAAAIAGQPVGTWAREKAVAAAKRANH
jgi:uncharacterized protein (DUF1778 family)